MPINNSEELALRSDEVQEILTKVPHWMIRWGNLLFLLLILMVLAISWLIKYPDIVEAQAVITTKNPPQKEYAQTGGKIEAILVQNNQVVEPNMPLAILENTANYQDVFKLKSLVDTLNINSKSFYFPIEHLSNPFLGEVGTQYALFENSYMQYILNKQLQPFSNESTANLYTIAEINHRLESAGLQRQIKENELALAVKALSRQKELFRAGATSAQEYEDQQGQFAQAELSYKTFETNLSQLKETLANARRTLRGTEINRINEEAVLFRSVLQSFNQLKKSIKDWERMYVLKSDIAGRVSYLNFWSVNQTVAQGDLVFTIIPTENSSYIAKLKMPARNSGKIELGQKVNIKLESYSELEFGVLSGQVDHISLIPDKEGFYLVDVGLPETLTTSYNLEVDFRQEMKGTAEIITEDLRLIERTLFHVMNIFKN